MRNPLASSLLLLLAACAGNPFDNFGVQPGMSRQEVISRAGTPNRVVKLPDGGERLQYSRMPFGQHAWMLDLDASGRMTSLRQVLNERDFNRIETGRWTRDDVEREYGRPATIDSVVSWKGPIYTYRWRNDADMLYFIYFDDRGVVQRAHPGMEFINAPDRD